MNNNKSIDPAVNDIFNNVDMSKNSTVWDRSEAMEPRCGFGELGICCKICYMGPCRIDPFNEDSVRGVCGATAEVIAARNFARMIAAGSAAPSNHRRESAHPLYLAVQQPGGGS